MSSVYACKSKRLHVHENKREREREKANEKQQSKTRIQLIFIIHSHLLRIATSPFDRFYSYTIYIVVISFFFSSNELPFIKGYLEIAEFCSNMIFVCSKRKGIEKCMHENTVANGLNTAKNVVKPFCMWLLVQGKKWWWWWGERVKRWNSIDSNAKLQLDNFSSRSIELIVGIRKTADFLKQSKKVSAGCHYTSNSVSVSVRFLLILLCFYWCCWSWWWWWWCYYCCRNSN